MFKFLRRHRTVVLITLSAVLVGLPLFGIGGSAFLSSQDAIIEINGSKVSQREFDNIHKQILRQQEDATPEQRNQAAGAALQELIRREVLFQEAKKYGIHVPEQELQMQIISVPAFQTEGQFDPNKYVQTVSQAFQMTPKEFENARMKELAARKLNNLIASSVHISDPIVMDALPQRLKIEEDKEKIKELKENPDILRDEIRNRDVNLVFNDWLAQINSNLKVNFISKTFQERLSGSAQ